jgi:hypothetical protein
MSRQSFQVAQGEAGDALPDNAAMSVDEAASTPNGRLVWPSRNT